MIHFECDYLEGAHPRIMEKLMEVNLQQSPGYGEDEHCSRARALIAKACETTPDAVHLLVGGTQANATVIDHILRPWEGVVCAATGHINVHEAGAIESSGHKVLSIAGPDGKLHPEALKDYCAAYFADATREHMVRPGMVYISFPTENGELYTKAELTSLRHICDEYRLTLYLDGARLGYGLAAPENDLTLSDIARLTDAFYIGGTKVGALLGEAVVLCNPALRANFRNMMKRHGAMLAKGRLAGIQFECLFESGLYMDISRHAIDMAERLRSALREKGFEFYAASPTNQLFPILTHAQREKLSEKYVFSYWAKVDDDRDAIRLCTSWATTEENLNALIGDLMAL